MILSEDCIKIGEISKSHNLKGEVVIITDNDLLERYVKEPFFILLEGGAVPFFIAENGLSVRNHASYIVKFDYVDSIEQAERIVGCEVWLKKENLKEEDCTGDEDYDVFALIGYSVVDQFSKEKGKITDVADYSGNIVLSVKIFGKEILLPLAEEYILEIDLEKKELLVRIPQEITDLY